MSDYTIDRGGNYMQTPVSVNEKKDFIRWFLIRLVLQNGLFPLMNHDSLNNLKSRRTPGV
jgi:hypothetical protein